MRSLNVRMTHEAVVGKAVVIANDEHDIRWCLRWLLRYLLRWSGMERCCGEDADKNG